MLEICDGPKTQRLKTTTSDSKHMVNPALLALHIKLLLLKLIQVSFASFQHKLFFSFQR